MIAISTLTHVISIHTNVELNSKHIRHKICRFCVEKKSVSPYGPCAPPTTDLCSDIIWIMSKEIFLLLFSFNLIPTSFR
jgi:hypothetical protein